MKIVPVDDIRAHFRTYLQQCEDEPVIIGEEGRPVAVLVSAPEDDELERFVLAHTPRFHHLLDEAEQRILQTGGIRHKDFWESIQQEGG